MVQFESCSVAEARLLAIDAIIDTMIAALAKAATTSNMKEYRIDDGQTKVSVTYQDVAAISAALGAMEKVKGRYVNRLNGRITQLRDQRNFPRRGYGF